MEENNSSWNDVDVEKILVVAVDSNIEYADIGLSYDSDTVSEVHHDTFENVFAHGIPSHEPLESNTRTHNLLNKAKDLVLRLYNVDEIGKDLLSGHKIISEEDLKCDPKQCLKVKQRKSPLSYHGFVYGETQFVEPPKVPLKRRDLDLKKHLEQAQLSNYDPKLWKILPMKYFCYVKQALLKF
ncbi:hypothetical protein Tco_0893434 [Tanacetum coccineum]|uniref:Uncharacterized protein n=1 Tax=Tanacetum coccineum TaxID=301880 RepID=A0ABQ5CAC7_9ASTR